MLLGTDGMDALQSSPSESSLVSRSPSYSPPEFEAHLPSVNSPRTDLLESLQPMQGLRASHARETNVHGLQT